MKTTNLKSITAVKFRLVLVILMSFVVILMVGLFLFGYQYMQSVSQETAKRQADASASEDSIGTLKRLQVQLKALDGLSEKLSTLRSSDTLPQFETERSLRAITDQLGLGIRDIEFIDSTATDSATPAATSTDRSSKISFQFNRPLTYDELIRFLDAIETSIPKLALEGVTIPAGSTRSSIELGTLTLKMATN